MDVVDAERAGSGGGIPYVSEVPCAEMFNQQRAHSCQVACARQLLADAGVIVSEEDLLSRIGIIEGWGTSVGRTAEVLDELHPNLGYAGGSVDPDWIKVFFKRDPWIAVLRTLHGTLHAVVVDRLEGDLVHLRDPWGTSGPGSGCGSHATIRLADFRAHWTWGYHNAVTPNRRK